MTGCLVQKIVGASLGNHLGDNRTTFEIENFTAWSKYMYKEPVSEGVEVYSPESDLDARLGDTVIIDGSDYQVVEIERFPENHIVIRGVRIK